MGVEAVPRRRFARSAPGQPRVVLAAASVTSGGVPLSSLTPPRCGGRFFPANLDERMREFTNPVGWPLWEYSFRETAGGERCEEDGRGAGGEPGGDLAPFSLASDAG